MVHIEHVSLETLLSSQGKIKINNLYQTYINIFLSKFDEHNIVCSPKPVIPVKLVQHGYKTDQNKKCI